ncbi:hypothetical protein ACJJTC_017584 [Scirpophaga incertulas]
MSDLENKKKERTVVKRIFTKYVNDLEAAIDRRETAIETQILFEKLKEKYDHLLRVDKIILDLLLTEVDEQILENELEVVMEYNTRKLRVNAKYKELAGSTTPRRCTENGASQNFHGSKNTATSAALQIVQGNKLPFSVVSESNHRPEYGWKWTTECHETGGFQKLECLEVPNVRVAARSRSLQNRGRDSSKT